MLVGIVGEEVDYKLKLKNLKKRKFSYLQQKEYNVKQLAGIYAVKNKIYFGISFLTAFCFIFNFFIKTTKNAISIFRATFK